MKNLKQVTPFTEYHEGVKPSFTKVLSRKNSLDKKMSQIDDHNR